jgi:hypothetical protein
MEADELLSEGIQHRTMLMRGQAEQCVSCRRVLVPEIKGDEANRGDGRVLYSILSLPRYSVSSSFVAACSSTKCCMCASDSAFAASKRACSGAGLY